MKLQEAAKREILRVSLGSVVCLAAMFAVFLAVNRLDRWVLLSGLCGTVVAVMNFAALCVTLQIASETENEKQMRSRVQLSYQLRLALQAGWGIVAYIAPCFRVIAGALPLLFPSAVIFLLHRGRYFVVR